MKFLKERWKEITAKQKRYQVSIFSASGDLVAWFFVKAIDKQWAWTKAIDKIDSIGLVLQYGLFDQMEVEEI